MDQWRKKQKLDKRKTKTLCIYYIKAFHEKKQCPVNLNNFCARKEKISKHTRNKITCNGFVLLKVRSVNLHLFPWVPVLIHTVFSSSPEYFVINFNEPDWRHIQELRIWLESKPAEQNSAVDRGRAYRCCCHICDTRSSHTCFDQQPVGNWWVWLLMRYLSFVRLLWTCRNLRNREKYIFH